jgi:uncharacterized protein with von Willebrand factor type A (vWA) domain
MTAGDRGPPEFVAARDHVRDELVTFSRALRRAGVDVPANAATDAARALVEIGFGDETQARAALRAVLVTEQRDIAEFDRMFGEFWRRLTAGLDPSGPADRGQDPPEGGLAPLGTPDEREDVDDAPERERDDSDGESGTLATESLVARNASEGASDEFVVGRGSPVGSPDAVTVPGASEAGVGPAFRALTAALGGLRGRRWTPSGSEQADARRALRASVGTGGTVLSLPQRDQTRPAIRAVFLVDVSQSVLDTLDRDFLLSVLQRAVTEWRDARAFFFDEGLREVTSELDAPTRAAALGALERAEAEWGGGTQIGASLANLPPDTVDHRTTVFVVSDGLETGDVSVLERELAAISGRAESVLWLNPLAASPEFEPTARGMAAALPFADGVFAFADPSDLAELARQLRQHGAGGRLGYEYDPRR